MSYARSLTNVLNDCKNRPDCNQAYPDLQNRFIEFLASLDSRPLEVELRDGTLAYLSKEEVNAIVHQMLYRYQNYPVVPLLLESFISRDRMSLGVLLEGMQYAVDGFNVLGLIEYNYDHKGTVADSRRLVAEAKQNLEPYALVDSYMEFYLTDTLIKTDSIAITPIKTSVPSLLMAAGYDPITPPEWTKDFSKNFSNYVYFELPKVGHGATWHPCGEKILQAFLDDPTSKIDADCINSSNFEIDFTTSYYKNPRILKLLRKSYLNPDPFLILLCIVSIIGIIISGILSLVRLVKKQSAAIHIPLLISSIVAVSLVSGLVYYTFQTMNTDSFLLVFGLIGTSAYIFWLVPVLVLTFLWFLVRFFDSKPTSKWYYVSIGCFLLFIGIISYYRLFPSI